LSFNTSDTNSKRSAISSLNAYIETYYGTEFPHFRSFITRAIKRPPTVFIKEKKPLTRAEFNNLIEVLKSCNEWQKIAYLTFSLDCGCRRAESMQLLRSVVDSEPIIKERDNKSIKFYRTHPIRCKGRGEVGKVRRLTFGEATMETLKRWVGMRQDTCPFMFITKRDGVIRQASRTLFNHWFANEFSKIVGRRLSPHDLRRGRATMLSQEDGVDVKKISALLGHDRIDTTTSHYIIRDDADDLDDLYIL